MTGEAYPIGRFQAPGIITESDRARYMETIARAPAKLRRALEGLTQVQLETPYREGGWTLRQVAHHMPESHMHAYLRFKLALTENEPVIKPYDESAWARLADVEQLSIEGSIRLLEILHERWSTLMRTMTDEQWKRRFIHPEREKPMALETVAGLYAWHGEHHTAHVLRTRERLERGS